MWPESQQVITGFGLSFWVWDGLFFEDLHRGTKYLRGTAHAVVVMDHSRQCTALMLVGETCQNDEEGKHFVDSQTETALFLNSIYCITSTEKYIDYSKRSISVCETLIAAWPHSFTNVQKFEGTSRRELET